MTKQDAVNVITQHPISDMITIGEDGSLAERAMWTAKVDDKFNVYFATFRDSNKCKQIKKNPGIVVVWPTGKGFLSLKGSAELTTDQAVLDYVWSDILASHFTGGSKDPTLIAIRITPSSLTCYEEGKMEMDVIEL